MEGKAVLEKIDRLVETRLQRGQTVKRICLNLADLLTLVRFVRGDEDADDAERASRKEGFFAASWRTPAGAVPVISKRSLKPGQVRTN